MHNKQENIYLADTDIYMVMMTKSLSANIKDNRPDFGDVRRPGCFPSLDMALNHLTHNIRDVREDKYDYAIIERVPFGFYATMSVKERYFYQFMPDEQLYFLIDEPKALEHFSSLTIG